MRYVGMFVALGLVTALAGGALARDLKDSVRVEIESVGLHPGMDPGMYVCASGHLHIKGAVENRSGIPLREVRVQAKAFAGDGTLLGTATTATKKTPIAAGEKAEINIEFLDVTGPAIHQVKRHEVIVLEAPSL